MHLNKETIVSRENILGMPIEFDISMLKRKHSDASKLINAVRKYYGDESSIEQYKERKAKDKSRQK